MTVSKKVLVPKASRIPKEAETELVLSLEK